MIKIFNRGINFYNIWERTGFWYFLQQSNSFEVIMVFYDVMILRRFAQGE